MSLESAIDVIKNNGKDSKELLMSKSQNEIQIILNKLGRLPDDFDKNTILYLLDSKVDKIRYLVIKNLAKLSDLTLLDKYKSIIKNDKSSLVRREAASAIGRLRNEQAIKTLVELLKDYDPEIVLQAIRGLLVFKRNKNVIYHLKSLSKHPNEIIKEVIRREFNNSNNYIDKNHTLSPDFLKNVVVNGNVLEILKNVPDCSIHLTFTSPPYYNARDYSVYQSYNEYLQFLEKAFKEIHRITKEGRFFILNTSPVIIPRVSRQHASKRYPIPYDIHPYLIKMGWEFIDDIVWIKPEASVKNRNAGFLQHRKPLGYKANSCTEAVMVYRKKTEKLLDWNIRQYKKSLIEKSKVKGQYETRNTWFIDPTFDKTHSAVFPLELCERIVKFYSFVGDLVFDPFAGSGTFGKAARKFERFFFLTELDKEYFQRIKENLIPENSLFSTIEKNDKYYDVTKFKETIKRDIS